MKKDSKNAPIKVNKILKLIQEVRGLDVENYGNWSRPVQVTSWITAGIFVCVTGFFVSSGSMIGLTSTEIETREQLIGEYQSKYLKYAGAVKYKDQLVQIEKSFNEQLQQLPKEKEIPGLLDDLNRAGKQAGLTIESLQLGTEVNKEFFVEQPIEIEASGDYHSFGKFVEMVSALPRIVTIQTFTAGERNEGVESRVPEMKYVIKASTYRYLNKQADPVAASQLGGT